MSVDRETPIECIAVWAGQLKKRGFDDKIKAEHWFGEWKDRKHVTLNGADSSILEITCANVYTRIVAGPGAPALKPFAFYRYVSTENADRPKTDWHFDSRPETYMDRSEVSALLAEHLF